MIEKKMGTQNEKWNEVAGSVSGKILETFLDSESDGFAILQLKRTVETDNLRFMPYDVIERQGQNPEINLYDTMYVGVLNEQLKDIGLICDNLYLKFNIDRPEDFKGHSLSVGDVIALKRQGEVNYFYVDSIGFRELQNFNSKSNSLRGIEDQIEQNDNQLDGIINNLPEETVAEKEAKCSVIEKIKVSVPEQKHKPRSLCCDRELD